MNMKPLRSGARIALVAPASPFSSDDFHLACQLLEQKGFEPHPGRHIFQKRGYLCGTESQRAQDLLEALVDPTVAAVVCVRGGYGSGRLIPWIPFASLPKAPKPFVGYSDITFLHQALQSQGGWVTLHGPNLVDLALRPEGVQQLSETLQGLNRFEWPVSSQQILRRGHAKGVLRGGNLTCLSHLVGTPHMPDLRNALLFLEDRGEALYRLDRVMTHLKLSGHLGSVRGLILGHFQDCGDPFKLWDMMLEHTHEMRIPIFAGMPFGHSWPNDILPLGGVFLMDSGSGIFKATSSFFEK